MASILVVDDRPDNLELVRRYLSASHHTVELATDAEMALRGIDSGQRFDLFVLDVVLPGMSGYDLCRTLRQREATKDVPVLFLSGERGGLPDRLHGFASGANDYLAKPVNPKELLARVDVMLRLAQALKDARRTSEQLAMLVDERTVALQEALKSLERQRDLWESVVRQLPAAVVVYDSRGDLVTANEVAVELVAGLVEGRPVIDTALRPFFQQHAAALRMRHRVVESVETRDGRRLLEAELTSLGPNGRHRVLHLVDVTERQALFEVERARGPVPLRSPEPVPGAKVPYRMSSVVGDSPAMARVHRIVDQLRYSHATVLITGPSGTGKELVARAIHFDGDRCDGPFVAVNCGAIPANLVESQLFGHVKGAFTGADIDSLGLFGQAERGTLLLDEVGECSPELQRKLLRVLQSGEVRPVGGVRVRRVDARLIAATNQPLADLVAEGKFREDLYYRLNVVPIRLPSLSERLEDIGALAQRLLEVHSARSRRQIALTGFSVAALRALEGHEWTGNVRQLENAVIHAVAFAIGPLVQIEDLPEDVRGVASDPGNGMVREVPAAWTLPHRVRMFEGSAIRDALGRTQGNKVEAARLLGIGKSSLYRKLKDLGMNGATRLP